MKTGSIESDRTNVANILGDCFSTMANSIGGPNANDLTEQDFINHPSIRSIVLSSKASWSGFQFESVKHR